MAPARERRNIQTSVDSSHFWRYHALGGNQRDIFTKTFAESLKRRLKQSTENQGRMMTKCFNITSEENKIHTKMARDSIADNVVTAIQRESNDTTEEKEIIQSL